MFLEFSLVKPDYNNLERNWLTAELFSSPAQLSSQAQSEMMVVEFPNIIILISQALRGLARAVLCCEAGYSPWSSALRPQCALYEAKAV